MNNDLISREALKKALEECKYCGFYGKLIELIDNAPTVPQVTVFCENADEKTIEELKAEMQKAKLAVFEERPQGEWIDTGSGQECNVCHEIQYGYDNFRHFCANCGAKMKGGAE